MKRLVVSVIVTLTGLIAMPTVAYSAAQWTFDISANFVGNTYVSGVQCDNNGSNCVPFSQDIPTNFQFNRQIYVPEFVGSTDIGETVLAGGSYGGRNYRRFGYSGTLNLSGGTIFGADFTFAGESFGNCSNPNLPSTCFFTYGGTPTFSVAFVESRGGSGPVPEPSTWALMLAGFGLVGGAMRRRYSLATSYA